MNDSNEKPIFQLCSVIKNKKDSQVVPFDGDLSTNITNQNTHGNTPLDNGNLSTNITNQNTPGNTPLDNGNLSTNITDASTPGNTPLHNGGLSTNITDANTPGNTPLDNGNLSTNITNQNTHGNTPLDNGSLSTNITNQNIHGNTPLHNGGLSTNITDANTPGNPPLDNGSLSTNITDANTPGNTSLHEAVELGQVETVKQLLDRGLDTDTQNSSRDTALHVAVLQKSIEMVQLLLSANADVHLHNAKGTSPLDIAKTNTDILWVFQVYEKLREFVQHFVGIYVKFLTTAWDRIENRIRKPGKTADFLNEILEIGKDGTEAASFMQPSLAVLVNVLRKGIASIGAQNNRAGLKKQTILSQMYRFKYDSAQIQKVLIESAIEVFWSFEGQFTQVTASGSWQRAIQKLAEDAVGRAINFYRESQVDVDFSVQSIVNGVILGKSKTFVSASTGCPHLFAGHTVFTLNGEKWNTANVYNDVGIINAGEEYFRKRTKENSSKFGHRRLSKWEFIDFDRYIWVNLNETATYKYVIAGDDKKRYNDTFKNPNSSCNPLTVDGMSHEIEEIIEIIESAVSAQHNELIVYFSNNLNELRNLLIKTEQINREIQGSIEDATAKNKAAHDKTQQMVLDVKEAIINLPSANKTNHTSKNAIWFEVREPITSFTGRQNELEQLKQAINHSIVFISGLGGVGKTELAIKFADQEFDTSNCVIFIQAETYETITNSFRRLMKELQLKTTDSDGHPMGGELMAKQVYEHLARFTDQRSLVIFDNVPDYLIIGKYITPYMRKSNICTVITTRDSGLLNEQEHGNFEKIQLNTLNTDWAVALVKKSLRLRDSDQDKDVAELVEMLGCLPLALQHTIAYIRETGTDEQLLVSEYVQLFKKSQQKMQEILNRGGLANYEKTIFITIKATIDGIKKHKSNISKLALKILNIIAYFYPDNIQSAFFSALAPVEKNFHSSSIKRSIANKNVTQAINLLQRHSVVSFDNGKISIHRLVQSVIQFDLRQKTNSRRLFTYWHNSEEEVVLTDALDIISEIMSKSNKLNQNAKIYNNYEIKNHFLTIWEHAKKYRRLAKKVILDSKINHQVFTMMDMFMLSPQEQEHFYSQVLKYQLEHCEPKNFQIAATRKMLGNAYGRLGEFEKMKDMLEQAVEIETKHLGSHHPQIEGTLMDLSCAYRILGDRHKEIKVLERAMVMQAKICGFVVMDTLRILRCAYSSIGSRHREMIVLERVMAIQTKHHGPSSFEVANTLQMLSSAYRYLGITDKEIEMLERALEIPTLASAEILVKLSNYYKGDSVKQKELLHRALDIYLDFCGPNHYHVRNLVFSPGNKDLLERVLDQGMDVFSRSFSSSVLHSAVRSNSPEVVDHILKRIMDKDPENFVNHMNALDSDGETPLMVAVQCGLASSVKVLLEYEADVNLQRLKGETALHLAVEIKRVDLVRQLIEKNAALRLQNVKGETALHWAARADSAAIFQLLIENRADPNVTDEMGRTPLEYW